MNGSRIAGERLVALFLLGILVLNPPFLLIFDKSAEISGIPVLYLYLFVAWAVLIALLALAIELAKPQRESDMGAAPQVPDAGQTPDDSGERS